MNVSMRLVRLLTGVPLKDTQSGLKAMKKSAFINVFPRLTVKRYAFDVELLAVANLYGLKVVEMPVNIKLGAKFKPKEMWRMFIDLLKNSLQILGSSIGINDRLLKKTVSKTWFHTYSGNHNVHNTNRINYYSLQRS